MTNLEFLEEGFKQGFLYLSCHTDSSYMFDCIHPIICDTCQFRPNCNTISCGIEIYHPELFQQLKDKCLHLFI